MAGRVAELVFAGGAVGAAVCVARTVPRVVVRGGREWGRVVGVRSWRERSVERGGKCLLGEGRQIVGALVCAVEAVGAGMGGLPQRRLVYRGIRCQEGSSWRLGLDNPAVHCFHIVVVAAVASCLADLGCRHFAASCAFLSLESQRDKS